MDYVADFKMYVDHEEHAAFWLALLKFGDDEEERRRNWNIYFKLRVGPRLSRSNQDALRKVCARLGLEHHSRTIERDLDAFRNRFGEICFPGGTPDSSSAPCMDFDRSEFPADVSFAGRMFIGASFRNSVFRNEADFEGAEFFGVTDFCGAKFLNDGRHIEGEVSFRGSTFHTLAKIDSAQFPATTAFDQTTFKGHAFFRGAEFVQGETKRSWPFAFVNFGRSVFKHEAVFSDADFGVDVEFQNVTFEGMTEFENARFRQLASFNSAEFKGLTSFRIVTFDRPP